MSERADPEARVVHPCIDMWKPLLPSPRRRFTRVWQRAEMQVRGRSRECVEDEVGHAAWRRLHRLEKHGAT